MMSPSFKCTLTLENAVEAMRFWVNLAVKDKCVVPTVATDGYAQIFSNFSTGKAAMVMHHGGSYIEVGKYFKYGTEVMTLARPKGPKAGQGFVAPLANGVFQHVKNPDAAFEYVAFLGGASAQSTFLKATGYFPTSADAASEKFIADNRQFDTAIASLTTLDKQYTFPGYTSWQLLTVLPEFQKCLVGTQTPEGAAKVIVDRLTAVAKAAAEANRKRYADKRGK
jgi:multiple sugar transport system substrate-binding protein